MKQIIQSLKTGEISVEELPEPALKPGQVLIQTSKSLISAGTERMLLEFGKANYLQKARQQPEKVKQVLDKLRADGLIPTVEAVLRRLDEPLALGYCNAGTVLAVGEGVTDLKPGDRVASNGPHAEIVAVPRNLCASIPDSVSDEEAAFTVLGSIALQGIRLANPTLGEKFLVFGAGLLGLLTVQLLKSNGCQVMAVDLNRQRLELAREFGAETVDVSAGGDPVSAALAWTGGIGVDGVIITASARGDQIVHQSAQSSRKRGRIILVGVVDLNLRRSDFYEKELTFQVSCSYGPGRYDPLYERKNIDYPIGFVRWTVRRNFEAILQLMAEKKLDVKPLISEAFPIERAQEAYEKIQSSPETLGVILEYPQRPKREKTVAVQPSEKPFPLSAIRKLKINPLGREPVVGLIGAGDFARSIILPILSKLPCKIKYISDNKSVISFYSAKRFGALKATTDYREILTDPEVDAVFITTAPSRNAPLAIEALKNGKNVFVEKPLAVNPQQLKELAETVKECKKILMVGFNRRFSPHIEKIKEWFSSRKAPLSAVMTVNAGPLPPDHKMNDPSWGRGRVVNEVCHFTDLLQFIAGSPIQSVSAFAAPSPPGVPPETLVINLQFEDGSIGAINYFSNGHKSYPKEKLEVFSEGKIAVLENFIKTTGYGGLQKKSFKTIRQEKGHKNELKAFVEALQTSGENPIPLSESIISTAATFAILKSLEEKRAVSIDELNNREEESQ